MHVTIPEYGNAVTKLLALTKMNCGGSNPAAQVLLGLYNSHEFHCDLVGVACGLDENYLSAAVTAIKGRGDCMTEPHNVIENGDDEFAELWERYSHLSISSRYQN